MRGWVLTHIQILTNIAIITKPYTQTNDISFQDRLHTKVWHSIYHALPMTCCSIYLFFSKWAVKFKCPLVFALSPGIITFYHYSLSLISQWSKISSNTCCTKLGSWVVSSLKWYTNLTSPGCTIVQCKAYCFPEKWAPSTYFLKSPFQYIFPYASLLFWAKR